jgi:hypothetical protein
MQRSPHCRGRSKRSLAEHSSRPSRSSAESEPGIATAMQRAIAIAKANYHADNVMRTISFFRTIFFFQRGGPIKLPCSVNSRFPRDLPVRR